MTRWLAGGGMQTRIAVVAGLGAVLWVLVAATLNPAAVPALLATLLFVAFVWAGVALVNPAWGPLSSRTAAVVVLLAAIGLFVVAGAACCRC